MSLYLKKKKAGEEIDEHKYEHIKDALVAAYVKYCEEKLAFETKLQQEDYNRRAMNGLATIREEPVDDEASTDDVSNNEAPALSESEKAYASIRKS